MHQLGELPRNRGEVAAVNGPTTLPPVHASDAPNMQSPLVPRVMQLAARDNALPAV